MNSGLPAALRVFLLLDFPSSLREGGGTNRGEATWCERRDSTPHAFRRWNLNPVRLPIPPLSRSQNYTRKRALPKPPWNRPRTDIIQKIQALPIPLPVDHYESFPVASWLLPRPLRRPIEAIYGFARGADDVADEGYLPDSQRLAGLDRYLQALDAIEAGRNPGAQFEAIEDAIREHRLPVNLLRDLIDAFKQDVVKKRYADFAELMDYSRRSANPIGPLLLHLFEQTGDRPLVPRSGTSGLSPVEQSDAICSSLQLINFWQDVAIDWENERVHIPLEDLARFGVEERAIAAARTDETWAKLIACDCDRARKMLASGAALGRTLPGRLGLEIRATVAGGAAILDKIDAVSGDVFLHRPRLGKLDWMRILARALLR